MSIYRPKGSPFYQYDFQHKGNRYCGSTRRKGRREAEAVERAERQRVERETPQAQAAESPLLCNIAARYIEEVDSSKTTEGQLALLVAFLGRQWRLPQLNDAELARIVAWRRAHKVHGHLISNATVNRSTTELLKRVWRRAALVGVQLPKEPQWRKHMLLEPPERVRELTTDESDALETATRPDLLPFFAFARASGLRFTECLLRWTEVNWDTGQIVKLGKGGRRVVTSLTPTLRAILAPLRGHHPEWVFTYVVQAGAQEGKRRPLTQSGAKTAWRRLRASAGVSGFRFHDFRHDLASKVLRETGNLKLAQKALNHRDIRSTLRCAHVSDSDVAAALEAVAKSRSKSRNRRRKAG